MARPLPPFRACSGTEPFVFVSYAHEDMAEVYEDIGVLDAAGYRIWYDEGIQPGARIDDEIAEKLSRCAYFMVFLSEHAIRSQYVQNEIHFALDNQKQLLAVHLRETVLPPGLQLRLSPQLAVLKHTHLRADYLKRLQGALPSSLERSPFEGLEQDFAREVTTRAQAAHGWTKTLEADLLRCAELLGLTPDAATTVIDNVLGRLGIIKETSENAAILSKLILVYMDSGWITPDRRVALSNRAKTLGISQPQMEAMVQAAAVTRAHEFVQTGDTVRAERLLVSCVGEVLPQSDDVRLLLEQLAALRRPSAPEGAALPPVVTVPAATVPSQLPSAPEPPREAAASDLAETRLEEDVRIVWVRIPAGLFLRGCPDEFIRRIERKYGVEADVLRTYPVKKEPLEQFWISRTAVTNAQYYAFVKAAGHRYAAGWRGSIPPYALADADKPVTGVTWHDSADFAQWLGARLPTRAEHEKAARGEDGRLFPWGNEFDASRCNTVESASGRVTAADAFPGGASPYGVLDLVGNVWEWVDGRRGELTMTVGGSYQRVGEIYGAAFFDVSRAADSSEKDLGFRVACNDVRGLLLSTVELAGAGASV